jgi:hypothetical protein
LADTERDGHRVAFNHALPKLVSIGIGQCLYIKNY